MEASRICFNLSHLCGLLVCYLCLFLLETKVYDIAKGSYEFKLFNQSTCISASTMGCSFCDPVSTNVTYSSDILFYISVLLFLTHVHQRDFVTIFLIFCFLHCCLLFFTLLCLLFLTMDLLRYGPSFSHQLLAQPEQLNGEGFESGKSKAECCLLCYFSSLLFLLL